MKSAATDNLRKLDASAERKWPGRGPQYPASKFSGIDVNVHSLSDTLSRSLAAPIVPDTRVPRVHHHQLHELKDHLYFSSCLNLKTAQIS